MKYVSKLSIAITIYWLGCPPCEMLRIFLVYNLFIYINISCTEAYVLIFVCITRQTTNLWNIHAAYVTTNTPRHMPISE